jgi:hypothetical protein
MDGKKRRNILPLLHRLSSPGTNDDDDDDKDDEPTVRARLYVLTAVTMLPLFRLGGSDSITCRLLSVRTCPRLLWAES